MENKIKTHFVLSNGIDKVEFPSMDSLLAYLDDYSKVFGVIVSDYKIFRVDIFELKIDK